MHRAVLSLGANVGDRADALQEALDALHEVGRVVAVSSVYESDPVGGPEQPDFLNAVALLETDRSPLALLQHCLEAEQAAGRVRGERWGPRPLDVDVVTYDDVVSDDPMLTLPHPRAHERAFVLRPWLDVDPDAVLRGTSVAELLVAVGIDGVRRTDVVLTLGPAREGSR